MKIRKRSMARVHCESGESYLCSKCGNSYYNATGICPYCHKNNKD